MTDTTQQPNQDPNNRNPATQAQQQGREQERDPKIGEGERSFEEQRLAQEGERTGDQPQGQQPDENEGDPNTRTNPGGQQTG